MGANRVLVRTVDMSLLRAIVALVSVGVVVARRLVAGFGRARRIQSGACCSEGIRSCRYLWVHQSRG
jgi:hypothetical protein